MFMKVARILIAIVAVVVGASVLWKNLQTSKANKGVHEAQAAMAAGNESLKNVLDDIKPLVDDENIRAFPNNRGMFMPKAKDLSELLGKASEQYRVAADKFQKASDEIADPVLKEYWMLSKDSIEKMADSKDEFRKIATAWMDESLKEWDSLNFRIREALNKGDALDDEAKAIAAKALKIHDEHKDKFEN
jgi:hypothetical protein